MQNHSEVPPGPWQKAVSNKSSVSRNVGGVQINTAMWKSVWKCLKKLKTELPYDSAISFWGIYLERATPCYKDISPPPPTVFITALSTVARRWSQPRCHQQMMTTWSAYKMWYYLVTKKNEITKFSRSDGLRMYKIKWGKETSCSPSYDYQAYMHTYIHITASVGMV